MKKKIMQASGKGKIHKCACVCNCKVLTTLKDSTCIRCEAQHSPNKIEERRLLKEEVRRETIAEISTDVLSNGSADREWVLEMLAKKYGELTGVNIPKRTDPLQEVLHEIVSEMFTFGHFMSKERMEELVKKIRLV